MAGLTSGSPIGLVLAPTGLAFLDQSEQQAARHRVRFRQADPQRIANREGPAPAPADEPVASFIVNIEIIAQASHGQESIRSRLGQGHEQTRAGDAVDAALEFATYPVDQI